MELWCLVSVAATLIYCIIYKELFAIVVAAYVRGPMWVVRRVEFLCDNKSVVAVLSSGTSRDMNLMVLLRYLALLAVCHSFSFTASWVRGKANPVANALSRFQFQRFRHLAPLAEQAPRPIPPALLTALQIIWQRDAIFSSPRALPLLHGRCTCLPRVAMLISANRMAV